MGGERNNTFEANESSSVLAPMAPGEQEERERHHSDSSTKEDAEGQGYCEEEDTEKDHCPVMDMPVERDQTLRKKNPIATRWCVCSILLFWIATGFAYLSFWLLVIDRGVTSWESGVLLSADEIALMKLQRPLNPRSLYCNPFTNPYCELYPAPAYDETLTPSNEAVCGVRYQWSNLFACPTQYSIQTYESMGRADELGAMLLHSGTCGACSTTQDMAAQAEWNLSIIARNCWKQSGAVYGLRKTSIVECIMAESSYAISPPCATLWSHFIREVMTECWKPCLFEDAMRNLVNGRREITRERYCRYCWARETDAVAALETYAGQSGLGVDDPHQFSVLDLNPCPNRGIYSVPRTWELKLDP